MRSIASRLRAGELLFGTWCNLGSSLTAEIAGRSGVDWLVLDLEHGAGDFGDLLHQLQAVDATPAVPIVRVSWNDAVQIKRVLDLGASGIMMPNVQTEDEARDAVRAMRYPPNGIRGVSRLNRAAAFGLDFADYFTSSGESLLTAVQIETPKAVDNVEAIAAVEGVDLLFVGPVDLTTSMGIQGEYDGPRFRDALKRVANACSAHGKAGGILAITEDLLKATIDLGFTFIAMGSDGGTVVSGMRDINRIFEKYR